MKLRTWATAAVVVAVTVGGVVPAARGDVPGPSRGQVAAAQRLAAHRASQLQDAEAQLIAAQATETALDQQVELAVERYDGAVVAQAAAEAQARSAAANAAAAAQARADAQLTAGQLAAQQYAMGGPTSLAGFEGLLRARNPEQARVQSEGIAAASVGMSQIVTAAGDAAGRAAAASTAAEQAAQRAVAATAAVQQARAQVTAQLATQQQQVALLAQQRGQLMAKLAAAERRALLLAEERREALAAQAARQAALRRARAAAAAAAAAARHQQSAEAVPAHGGTGAVVAFARAQLGDPYVWGGAGPNTFDCSGLTMRAWQRAGVQLPHYAADQYAESTPLSYGQLRPGDLVFWSHSGSPTDIYHVALYIGDDRMIEAPRTGDVVKIASLWIMGTPDFYARP